MPKYLTAQMYRDEDTGMLTPEITDRQLSTWIQNAEADIDAFMGFTMQSGGFELHREWTQDAWDYSTLRTRIPNWPVPAQNVFGYKIQVSNVSTAGSGFFATINPGDVVINVYNAYVEIVPLQAVTYALSPVLLQLGLKPPLVQLEYQAGFYFPRLGETLFNKGDNLTYYALHGFWATTYTTALHIQPLVLPPIPPVVYKNGVVQTTGFTLNPTEGTVTFTTPLLVSDVVTMDYTHTIPAAVKHATVARTTWLLGQRQLAKMGMVGLDQAIGGEQRAVRYKAQSMRSGLYYPTMLQLIDADTANKLLPYVPVAVG